VAGELLKLSQALTRVHDIHGVLLEAFQAIPAMIECSGVSVYLRKTDTGEFQMVARESKDPQDQGGPPTVPAAVAEPFLLSLEEPFVLARDVVASVPEPYRNGADEAQVIAPLRWEPEGFGALVISASSPKAEFWERDLELARGIADIASLALGNASRFRELEESAARLQALDEMKNMFLDAVSHELRTPLAAVLGIALTLGRADVLLSEVETRDLLERLMSNAKKLDHLLSDLLDLDRLARGIVEPNRKPTDVGELVRAMVESTDLLERRTVNAEIAPVVLGIDAAKVERIVENLLANTARHTPEGGTVWVRVTPEVGGVLIGVDDEGPGVPDELKEAIFEPFRQGARRNQHSPGVGIGLSLVARFAQLHGGRAWVEDRPGGGAAFRVFVPGDDDAAEEEGADAPDLMDAASVSSPAQA
jgi:signal transduction histidine kinase